MCCWLVSAGIGRGRLADVHVEDCSCENRVDTGGNDVGVGTSCNDVGVSTGGIDVTLGTGCNDVDVGTGGNEVGIGTGL